MIDKILATIKQSATENKCPRINSLTCMDENELIETAAGCVTRILEIKHPVNPNQQTLNLNPTK